MMDICTGTTIKKSAAVCLLFLVAAVGLCGCSFFPRTSTTASVVGEGYKVMLPDSYSEDTKQKYPVVYVLPEDGMNASDSSFPDRLRMEMVSEDSMDAIIVVPDFKEMGLTRVEDPYDFTRALVKEVDEKYHTMADPKWRMIAGRGSSAALAEAFALTGKQGQLLSEPDIFGVVGSVEPEYDKEDYIWQELYSYRFERLSNNDDPASSGVVHRFLFEEKDESIFDEIGRLGEDSLENAAYVLMNGFSGSILEHYLKGSTWALGKPVLTGEDQRKVSYDIMIASDLAGIAPKDHEIETGLSVVRQKDGSELEWVPIEDITVKKKKVSRRKGQTYIKCAYDEGITVNLEITVLGMDYVADSFDLDTLSQKEEAGEVEETEDLSDKEIE